MIPVGPTGVVDEQGGGGGIFLILAHVLTFSIFLHTEKEIKMINGSALMLLIYVYADLLSFDEAFTPKLSHLTPNIA